MIISVEKTVQAGYMKRIINAMFVVQLVFRVNIVLIIAPNALINHNFLHLKTTNA
jgi:hypothetical protein